MRPPNTNPSSAAAETLRSPFTLQGVDLAVKSNLPDPAQSPPANETENLDAIADRVQAILAHWQV